jgi:hypothetical protein
LDWKKWLGNLLVKGKYALLKKLDADSTDIASEVQKLEPLYKEAPTTLVGYSSPKIKDLQKALQEVAKARSTFEEDQRVTVETEYGDIILPSRTPVISHGTQDKQVVKVLSNKGHELLKVRYPDMLGNAQWKVVRAGRLTKVEILHRSWLNAYHRREFSILPGDSLDCTFEEHIGYDIHQNEVERKISILEVFDVISPPKQVEIQV